MANTALRINCGTCTASINVPYPLLGNLLISGRFKCPGCSTGQTLQMPSHIYKKLEKSLHTWEAAHGVPPSSLPENMVNPPPTTKPEGNGGASSHGPSGSPMMSEAASEHKQAGHAISKPRQQRLPPGSSIRAPQPENEDLELELEAEEEEHHVESEAFTDYKPKKLKIGSRHPDPVVETASLSAVDPPDITYELKMNKEVLRKNRLSALQLEAIVYSCQRHEKILPDGNRAGFFIGDGAGVGKGRTLAGLVMENWVCGRRRHIWVSTSSDLKFDAERDLYDVLGKDIEVHPLNKLPYGKLSSKNGANVQEGVIFVTYSSLIAQSDRGRTRLRQLVEWCGRDFDGLLLFDECHKAKNLIPDKSRQGEATRTGAAVLDLQKQLPMSRVVYCSATGASEPRHLGYMVRLGLWGPGNPSFSNFQQFLNGLGSRGIAALELLAMDMKTRGMYVCRSLSFANCEFEILNTELEASFEEQYRRASAMWNKLRSEFIKGEATNAERSTATWRSFWATHQRFFRAMCMSAKVPMVVQKAKEAVEGGKCVVIGLQSTGEAVSNEAIAERGTDIEDFISGPKEMLLRVLEDHFPLPSHPDKHVAGARAELKELLGSRRAVNEALRIETEEKADQKKRAGTRDVKYNPVIKFTSDSDSEDEDSDDDDDDDDDDEEVEEMEAAIVGNDSDEEVEDNDGRSKGARKPNEDTGETPVGAEGQRKGRGRPPSRPPKGEDSVESGKTKLELFNAAKELFDSAIRRKEELREEINNLELPKNPLDDIIDKLGGASCVAEMTGRRGRFVRKADGGVQFEARNASGVNGAALDMVNVAERELFQSGEKLVAVISEAASAGISLHADRRMKNKARRVHLTLELPWSADKAIQQFGRSHRSNEVTGPQYYLCFTSLGGEKRFAAAVSKRLETLGALTQGDRRAGPSLGESNYDSEWGREALVQMYDSLLEEVEMPVVPPMCQQHEAEGEASAGEKPAETMTVEKFAAEARFHLLSVGLLTSKSRSPWNIEDNKGGTVEAEDVKISDSEKVHVPRFLNRLLGLAPPVQKMLFDFFQEILDRVISRARRDGVFDDGIVDIKGDIKLIGKSAVVYRDVFSQAPTYYSVLETDRGVSWEKAKRMLELGMVSATQLEQHERAAAAKVDGPGGSGMKPKPAARRRRGLEPADIKQAGEDPPQAEGKAPQPATLEGSGFYQSRTAFRGGLHPVVLAVRVPGGSDQTAMLRITRPSTGTFGKEIKLKKLLTRYKQLKEDEAKAVWVRQYEDSRSTRVRKLHLLRGLVLPVWGVVENALLATAAKQGGNNGKKLRVARLLVRGADLGADGSGPQDPSNKEDGAAEEARLVGILVPRDSLKEVLQGLLQQQEHLKLHSAELVAQAAMAAAANTALVKTAATADECADRDSAGSKRRRLDGGGAEEPRCKRVLRPRAQEGSSGYESGSEQEPPFPATRQTRGRAMGGAWAEGSRRETRSSAKASQPKGKRIVRKRHAKSTVLVSSDSEEEDEAAQ